MSCWNSAACYVERSHTHSIATHIASSEHTVCDVEMCHKLLFLLFLSSPLNLIKSSNKFSVTWQLDEPNNKQQAHVKILFRMERE